MGLIGLINGFFTPARRRTISKVQYQDLVRDWTDSQMQESFERVKKAAYNCVHDEKLLNKKLTCYKSTAKYWHALAAEAAKAGDHELERQALTCRHFYCTLVCDLLHFRNRGINGPK